MTKKTEEIKFIVTNNTKQVTYSFDLKAKAFECFNNAKNAGDDVTIAKQFITVTTLEGYKNGVWGC